MPEGSSSPRHTVTMDQLPQLKRQGLACASFFGGFEGLQREMEVMKRICHLNVLYVADSLLHTDMYQSQLLSLQIQAGIPYEGSFYEAHKVEELLVDDVFTNVISKADWNTLCRMRLVCRSWRNQIDNLMRKRLEKRAIRHLVVQFDGTVIKCFREGTSIQNIFGSTEKEYPTDLRNSQCLAYFEEITVQINGFTGPGKPSDFTEIPLDMLNIGVLNIHINQIGKEGAEIDLIPLFRMISKNKHQPTVNIRVSHLECKLIPRLEELFQLLPNRDQFHRPQC